MGEVTLHFMVLHGSNPVSSEVCNLIRHNSPSKVTVAGISPLIEKIKEPFHNWIIFNLHYSNKTCKHNMFERTLVAQRRGLSRDGREILASTGCLMKRTMYDNTLKDVLGRMSEAQR